MAVLPFDILSNIVALLSDSNDSPKYIDIKTLKALSLTCYPLLEICRRQIFSSISLLPRVCDDNRDRSYYYPESVGLVLRLRNMEKLVESSPTITQYVHTLTYNSRKSNASDESLVRLLTKFTLVTSLNIAILRPSIPKDFDWMETSPSVRVGLKKIIQLPTLVSLDVSVFHHFDYFLLFACSNLQRLVLGQVDQPGSTITLPSSTHVPPRLRYLSGPFTAPMVELLRLKRPDGLLGLDISGLDTFRNTTSYFSPPECFTDLIGALHLVSNLRCMCLSVYDFNNETAAQVLHTIPNLQELELNSFRSSLIHAGILVTPSLILERVSLLHLRDLRIVSFIQPSSSPYPLKDLKELDKLLSSPSYPSLESLSIIVPLNIAMSSAWRSVLQTHMPRLSNSSMKIDCRIISQ